MASRRKTSSRRTKAQCKPACKWMKKSRKCVHRSRSRTGKLSYRKCGGRSRSKSRSKSPKRRSPKRSPGKRKSASKKKVKKSKSRSRSRSKSRKGIRTTAEALDCNPSCRWIPSSLTCKHRTLLPTGGFRYKPCQPYYERHPELAGRLGNMRSKLRSRSLGRKVPSIKSSGSSGSASPISMLGSSGSASPLGSLGSLGGIGGGGIGSIRRSGLGSIGASVGAGEVYDEPEVAIIEGGEAPAAGGEGILARLSRSLGLGGSARRASPGIAPPSRIVRGGGRVIVEDDREDSPVF